MVDRSQEIYKAMKNMKKRSVSEDGVYLFARSSVVADIDLLKGHKITDKDIWVRRPGSGEIAAYDFDLVIGRTLLKDVKRNEQLKWDNFEPK
jgi:N-acetylneuraminate synthase